MRTIVTVLLAITLTLAAGCTTEEPGPSTSPEATDTFTVTPDPTEPATPAADPTESSEPAASPSPTTTLSPEQQAAADLAMEFFRVQEEVDADLDADVAPLMATLDGNMLRMVTENLTTMRERGLIVSGSSSYNIWKVEEPTTVDGERQVVLFACMDSTGVETLDAETGLPAEDAIPPQFLDYRLVIAERNDWKIIDGGTKEVDKCP